MDTDHEKLAIRCKRGIQMISAILYASLFITNIVRGMNTKIDILVLSFFCTKIEYFFPRFSRERQTHFFRTTKRGGGLNPLKHTKKIIFIIGKNIPGKGGGVPQP